MLLPLSIEKARALRIVVPIAIAVLSGGTPAYAASPQQQATGNNWRDGSGTAIWKNGTNKLCWRDAEWTPATADTRCDGLLDVAPEHAERVPPPPIGAEQPRIQADAWFDLGKSMLKPLGRQRLDELAEKLSAVNLEVVVVTGFTDRLGRIAYNDELSLRRALVVKTYLVSKGVPVERIYTEGKGTRNPVTARCNEKNRVKLIACLAPDRRVEIEVLGTFKR
ncbi:MULTISPECIES: OmpA family protein [Burkholderia]|nr:MULTISPECIES: OmpA family protein [Burkholderia]